MLFLLLVTAEAFVGTFRRHPLQVLRSAAIEEPRTELSDSFDSAVADASGALRDATNSGEMLVRMDFDTSGGDATYTTLKNSMEFTRAVAADWARDLDGKTLCLFFPDAGAAALAASQWKVGQNESLVPANVRLAGFPRDKVQDDDAAIFVICPKASEATATERLVETAAETMDTPVAILNPELVDMGTTGYGLAGRMLKQRLLDNMLPIFCLRTLEWGALVKTYPMPYSVYQADDAEPGGYRYLKSSKTLPNGEDLEEIYEEFNPPLEDENGGNPFSQAADGLGKFIQGFSKL